MPPPFSPFPSFIPNYSEPGGVDMLTDSFEDGNFTSNPEWFVSTGDAVITTTNPRTGTYAIVGDLTGVMEHTLGSPKSTVGSKWAYHSRFDAASGSHNYTIRDDTNNANFRIQMRAFTSDWFELELRRTIGASSTTIVLDVGNGSGDNPDPPSGGWTGKYWRMEMELTATGVEALWTDGTNTYETGGEIAYSSFENVEVVRFGLLGAGPVDDVTYDKQD